MVANLVNFHPRQVVVAFYRYEQSTDRWKPSKIAQMRMKQDSFVANVSAMVLSVLLVAGCGDRIDTSKSKLDPQSMASKAMELYDKNSDGALDSEELEQSPALLSAMARVDSDRDGRLTAEEIAGRFEQYSSLSTFIPGQVKVYKQGRPLMQATVTFEPEEFMRGTIPIYQGTTTESGEVFLKSEPATLGLAVGFYQVTIERANGTKSTLGCEIADDSEYASRVQLEF